MTASTVDTYEECYWGGIYGYYGFAPCWGPGSRHPRYPYDGR
jgi:hypothetical protein